MKTAVLNEPNGVGTPRVHDRPDPIIGPEDVLIRVHGAAINRIDLSLAAGRLGPAGLLAAADEYHPGWDVAGEVVDVGRDVRRLAVGDEVIGLRDVLGAGGTHADIVALHQSAVAGAPRSISATEAAALPLAGLTAYGALRATRFAPGSSLLVTGANGGVGRAVVELAALYDLDVVALADPEDTDELRSAGATQVVHRGPGLARSVRALVPRGVDAVVDTAVLGPAAHEAVRDGGRFVALVRPFAPAPVRGTSVVVHEVQASAGALAIVAALVDAGHLSVRVAGTFPLEKVADAYADAQRGGLRGRVVLVP
jgi:NADPH:quinone reductase-like Zn-dependent oxidoreductase